MQTVVDQQHRGGRGRVAEIAGELCGISQTGDITVGQRHLQLIVGDHEPGDGVVAARIQRDDVVEESAGVGDHLVAADLVVALAFVSPALLADDVGAVEGVIQGAPARVGGVESETCVEDRYHQLRSGGRGDLRVHTRGRDGEIGRLGKQVADVGEEALVLARVDAADDALAVPLVDRGLQFVSARQQPGVARREVADHLVDTGPEAVRVQSGSGQSLVRDEVVQAAGHPQIAHRHPIGRGLSHSSSWKSQVILSAGLPPSMR